MKIRNVILLLVLSMLLFFCKSKEDKIELVQNYDEIYFGADQVDTPAEELKSGDADKMIKETENLFQGLVTNKSGKATIFKIAMRLYLNESGKIDKVKFMNPDEYNFSIDTTNAVMYQDYDKAYPGILLILDKYEFKPAVKNGNDVKFKKDIVYAVKIFTDGKVKEYIPLDLDLKFNDKDFVVTADKMPTIIGGIKTIQKNIVYPEIAKRAGIEGKVFIKVFLDEKGNVIRVEVIKGIGAGCDESAVKAVEKAKFTPGIKDGKPVKTQVAIPIMFKLN